MKCGFYRFASVIAQVQWAFLLSILSLERLEACGFNWNPPQGHFEGVDGQGYVLYVDKLATMDLGRGLEVPIYAIFKSNLSNNSPFLGQGWEIPLLESHVVQVDENVFQIWQPDGSRLNFRRNKADSPLLRSFDGSWVARISGDTITAWAACGWRVTYIKGKIASIQTPDSRHLDFDYEDGRVSRIREGPVTLLSTEITSNPNHSADLIYGTNHLVCSLADRPLIQTINGRNVVGSVAQSLSKVTFPDGNTKSYKFSLSPKLDPVLEAGGFTIQWDPVTQLVTKENDWSYKFLPGSLPVSSPQIFRTNSSKHSEYYYDDLANGTTTEQGSNGVKTITTRFVKAGPLSGKIRTVTKVINGITTTLRRCDYDEKGKMIRELVQMSKPHELLFKYDSFGRESEIDMDGKTYITKQYDSQGRLIGKVLSDGVRMSYAYLGDSIEKTIMIKDGKTLVEKLNDKYQPINNMPSIIAKSSESK